jgi:4-cresol dehydrogenase (hydroxylating)
MLDRVLAALQGIVGPEHTLTTESDLKRYRWCTEPVRRRIGAVVRPGSVEQVQALMRAATASGVALYPISTGHNWGYGSAQPMRDDNVVVDLSRMNHVVEVNSELAYAVIEPGVTQRQLFDHLRSAGLRLSLNPTGAGPSCSILANTLERGFGIGPNGDHFLAQCGMEVVLPTGELLQTGFGHYEGARTTYVYKWGVGPYLDGLFTQSNYGIVTKIGVWLQPAPEHFEACYFTCNSESQLGPVVDAVRGLLFDNVFRGPVNLLHRNRVLIMLGQYPWADMAGDTPLSEAVAQRLASAKRVGAWNGVGAVCGGRFQVRGAKQTIRQALRGKVDRLVFLSESRLRLLRRYPKALSAVLGMNVPELLKALENSYGMMQGVPSEIALSLSYWRNRRMAPPASDIDPARDNCGVMWFAPIIPMTPADVARFRSVVEPVFARHRFECCITFTAVNERCFDCTLPLLYNKDDAAEEQRALACYADLVEQCRTQGYLAYRLGLQSMDAETHRAEDVFWRVTKQLKDAFDPAGVLAPGRYAR